jgi:hypothetical protein
VRRQKDRLWLRTGGAVRSKPTQCVLYAFYTTKQGTYLIIDAHNIFYAPHMKGCVDVNIDYRVKTWGNSFVLFMTPFLPHVSVLLFVMFLVVLSTASRSSCLYRLSLLWAFYWSVARLPRCYTPSSLYFIQAFVPTPPNSVICPSPPTFVIPFLASLCYSPTLVFHEVKMIHDRVSMVTCPNAIFIPMSWKFRDRFLKNSVRRYYIGFILFEMCFNSPRLLLRTGTISSNTTQ